MEDDQMVPAPPSDGERRAMAWRNAMRSSVTQGDHGTVKVSKFFTRPEGLEVARAVALNEGYAGLPVAAGWVDGALSWILLTRALLFRDAMWKSVSPWDASIAWGLFKGIDGQRYRKAAVTVGGTTVGDLTYETGAASMVPMHAWLTLGRLRRPEPCCCADLDRHLNFRCDEHPSVFECPDNLVARSWNGSIEIIVHDGGSSLIGIRYCPWCGRRISRNEEQ